MSLMLDEVREQPSVLERTLNGELKKIEQFRVLMDKLRPRMVVLAARGTSDNAAQFGRYALEILTGIPVSLAAPSITTLYGSRIDYRDALVVAVSQSGESTDTNLVLERAKEQGAVTVGITNEANSSMAKLADHVFLVRAGKEKSVAATKTYTGQVLMMYLLAYGLGARIKLSDLQRLPEFAHAAMKIEKEVARSAGRYRFMNHAVVVGRGLNYSNAFEFALKMMETCYVVAERFSSADFAHGPIALVEQSFPMFLFAPSGVTWPSIKEMIVRLQALNADTLIITDKSNPDAAKMGRVLVLPVKLPELFTPIPYIVPAQIFAGSLAAEKGLNPDQPRTLTKVTLTM